MLAYMCKNCRQLTIMPLENEFNEHFCTYDCYEKYCEKNNYKLHIKKLKLIKNAFTN